MGVKKGKLFMLQFHERLRGCFAVRWSLTLVLGWACSAPSAVEMRNFDAVSPINGQIFPVLYVPPTNIGHDAAKDTALADMGSDDDGCRHSSGATEYDYYIATDPRSYFSALVPEWDDKDGRFRAPVTAEFRAWVEIEFNGELKIDINKFFQNATSLAKQRGVPPPDRTTFVIPQGSIPIERKYEYAYQCYEKRGARPAVLAKVALMGACALRCGANLSVAHPSLAGGYSEVNDKVARKVKDGEKFSIAKWLPIYRSIFEDERLTDEGYFIAGMTTLGLELRDGNLAQWDKIIESLNERLKELKNGEVMRGLVRNRMSLKRDYLKFLKRSSAKFMEAIASEEFSRIKLPETMLVVAESLRRQAIIGTSGGDAPAVRAMDWYLAISKMPETQPNLRSEMRGQGKAPSPDAPYAVQLGWIADRQIENLTKAGVVHPGTIAGLDRALLTAIVFDGLGTSEYINPGWKPMTGGTQVDCAALLNQIGMAAMESAFRYEVWPTSLGQMWELGVIRDRNYINRFHCPVTGKPFLYTQLPGSISTTAPTTVILVTSEPVPTNQGPRFGVFMANKGLAWSVNPVKPGEIYKP